jgi:DNA repair protein RadA/Sms
MSEAARSVRAVVRGRIVFGCETCGQRSSQWAGRCPACGSWGTIQQLSGVAASPAGVVVGRPGVPLMGAEAQADRRVPTGSAGLDRVLGGGLVPSSVTLLAGAPGIGKSTLLLHLLARLSEAGLPCLLVSGEESHAQVAARARRIGLAADSVTFASGRELDQVLATARAGAPFLLAVDSIQALRDTTGTQMPGGVSQVRTCTDALVGLAKTEGMAVVVTGHVTKDGDLAGPRALEHAVDVVLGFEGDPWLRSAGPHRREESLRGRGGVRVVRDERRGAPRDRSDEHPHLG